MRPVSAEQLRNTRISEVMRQVVSNFASGTSVPLPGPVDPHLTAENPLVEHYIQATQGLDVARNESLEDQGHAELETERFSIDGNGGKAFAWNLYSPLNEFMQGIDSCDIHGPDEEHEHGQTVTSGGLAVGDTPVPVDPSVSSSDSLIYDVFAVLEDGLLDTERDGQRRAGGRVGRGGRTRGTGLQTRAQYSAITKYVLCRRILALTEDNAQLCGGELVSVVEELYGARLNRERCVSEAATFLQTAGSQTRGKGVEGLHGPVLGVCARFTQREKLNPHQANARERHVACTWVDNVGNVHCTCVGSTKYRINVSGNLFSPSMWCKHTEAFRELLVALGDAVDVDATSCGKALSILVKQSTAAMFGDFCTELPLYTEAHGGAFNVLVTSGVVQAYGPCWIPIRSVPRTNSNYICAFCDVVQNNRCQHVRTYIQVKMHGGTDNGAGLTSIPNSPVSPSTPLAAISHLPLAPVNCPRAIKIDSYICDLTKKGWPFVVAAPNNCMLCESPRDEDMQSVLKGGVVLSVLWDHAKCMCRNTCAVIPAVWQKSRLKEGTMELFCKLLAQLERMYF